jgi:carboxylesterase
MGMCMGALLASVVAHREKHAKGNLVMLAPPVYIDGWATPWYRGLRPLLYHVPGLPRTMKIEEEDPFGIKNEQLRAIVKAKFERGENFHYRWVPLECLRQVDRLRAIVMKAAREIRCPTLVVHAREDELTSLRSANFMVKQIGGGRARMVVLEDSYHMICVDNDREIVARNVLEFFGAAMPGATSALANDPRMSPESLAAAVEASLAKLAAGDFTGLRDLAIPDLAWVQPGVNRMSGAHMGKTFTAFASKFTQGHAPRFTAFGTPAWNRGVALVPATLAASRDGASLQSQGALLLAYHGGKLLEARWFADDVETENAFFGEPEPEVPGAASLDADFDAAAAASKTLRKAPDNDTLLALYSLYKQASVGDVSGERPGALDMVNRAKYDAWMSRKGTLRDDAMRAYIELVKKLKSEEG